MRGRRGEWRLKSKDYTHLYMALLETTLYAVEVGSVKFKLFIIDDYRKIGFVRNLDTQLVVCTDGLRLTCCMGRSAESLFERTLVGRIILNLFRLVGHC